MPDTIDGHPSPSVLVADDDPGTRRVLQHKLSRDGYRVLLADDGDEAIARLDEDEVTVALLDLVMPRVGGMECLRHISAHYPDTQAIMITGRNDARDAVAALRAGALDYVTKPLDLDDLLGLVRRACRTAALSRENRQLREAISLPLPGAPYIGHSAAARQMMERLRRIAALEATVLLTGESGVGKGVVARLIHAMSRRAARPFVTVNCVALPRELVESELFGHERGAFTGAHARRLGRVEMADGGTLFLDEIGEMPLDVQPKLLNFLQERVFQRVGGNAEIGVDVRVIASTNRDLRERVRQRRFREDLYFRLNVLPLRLLPLRERTMDVLDLAGHLLARVAARRGAEPVRLSPEAGQALVRHPWPGNVRELENALERAAAFCREGIIRPEDLDLDGAAFAGAEGPGATSAAGRTLAEIENEAIVAALRATGGNKAAAARRLGLSEKTIYNKLRRMGFRSDRAR